MAQKTTSLKAATGVQLAEVGNFKPRDSVAVFLASMAPEIKKALPKHMDKDKIVRIAMTEIRKNDKLAECDATSLAACLMRSAQLGLEIGSDLGLVYLVPYKEECQLIIGWRGMMELARRSGMIKEGYAYEVREEDLFHYKLGLNRDLIHEPAAERSMDDASITHAYAVIKLHDGGLYFDVMSRQEIDAIMVRSAAYKAYKKYNKSGPWQTDYAQMARKTVIRRLFKMLPCSTEQMAVAVREANKDEAIELGFDRNTIIDTTAEPEPPHDKETGEIVNTGTAGEEKNNG